MNRSKILVLVAGFVCIMGPSACGQEDSPAKAVDSYLQSRIASDEAKMIAVSCKDWEGKAKDEAASFKSMNAKLDGVSCSQKGEDGQFTVIICTGKIVTTYAGETRDVPLRNFKVIKEDGQWKMCGYQ